MATFFTTLGAAAGAAIATYYFDPQQGRRRRALVRDKVYGRMAHFDEGARVPDEVLRERVRAKLGRVVSHPAAVEVAVSGSIATLSGPVLARERKRLVRAIAAVPGVASVVDRLEAHKQAGDIPALQGGRRREQRMDIAQEHWAPATRMAAGLGGAWLAYRAIARRSAAAPLLLLAGVALIARAGSNMDMRRLLGARGHLGIDFIKTITIAAPVDQVFALWRDFENFPKFMRNVRRVYRTADDNWHWEVAGPLGVTMQWNAAVTQLVPNEHIAWSTTPDSPVQHAGMVRFQEEGGGTRVQVQMSYNPPAGALGHVVAMLFGSDPRQEMDEDLMRMKALFETGKAPRHRAGG